MINTDQNYVYSSKAYWRNGGYGPMMSALGGTLGLTASGRLIFTLDGGKILFSSPVALIKRKNESMYGWMRFVVGPRLYTLQFYVNDRSAAMAGLGNGWAVASAMTDAAKGREAFNAWVDHLDKAQAIPPDNEQLIAAVPTPSILRARKFGMRTYRRFIYTVLLTTAAAVVLGFTVGLLNAGRYWTAIMLAMVIGIGSSIFIYKRLKSLNKQRQQADAESHGSDVAIQTADILPGGTPPSGNFGLTTGKQLLLAPVFIAGALLAVFGSVFIVMVIIVAIRKIMDS